MSENQASVEKNEDALHRKLADPVSQQAQAAAPEAGPTEINRALSNPRAATPGVILSLQRLVGNRAVTRLIQRKLTVGAAHDQYEQEADRVANQVVNNQPPAAASGQSTVQRAGKAEEEELRKKPLAGSISRLVQRAAKPEDEEEKKVQTQRAGAEESFETTGDFEGRVNASRGSGNPLPGGTREFMESRFGADFGDVRVHSDSQSAQLNREVSAQAFTQGTDIYLGEGKTDLQSSDGQHLLAHELTHVVQQTGKTQRATQDNESADKP